MSFLVPPQHEQFYPEGLSVFVPFPLEFYLTGLEIATDTVAFAT